MADTPELPRDFASLTMTHRPNDFWPLDDAPVALSRRHLDFPQKWRRKIPQAGGLAISREMDRLLRSLEVFHGA